MSAAVSACVPEQLSNPASFAPQHLHRQLLCPAYGLSLGTWALLAEQYPALANGGLSFSPLAPARTVEESAHISGFDAHKRVKGRKRHLLVDTLGIPLSYYVTPADLHDGQGSGDSLVD